MQPPVSAFMCGALGRQAREARRREAPPGEARAAAGRRGGLDKLDAGNRAQHVARLRRDLLRVLQVAGVLEGDAQRERRALWPVGLREQLGDVDDGDVEIRVFQMRATTGGVRDDDLCAGGTELSSDAVGELESL